MQKEAEMGMKIIRFEDFKDYIIFSKLQNGIVKDNIYNKLYNKLIEIDDMLIYNETQLLRELHDIVAVNNYTLMYEDIEYPIYFDISDIYYGYIYRFHGITI